MKADGIRDERLFLLNVLDSSLNSVLAHDPLLDLRMRTALSELERDSNDLDSRRAKVKELSNLYIEYGPSTIQCLIESIFLLHSEDELDDILSPVLDRMEQDLEENILLTDALLSELTNFSMSPYHITRKTVTLILKRVLKKDGVTERILDTADVDFELAFAAVEDIVDRQRQNLYPRVITLIKNVSKGANSEDFLRKTRPLIRLFAHRTGEAGLKVAIELFRKGQLNFPQKHYLLACFGMTFYRWFIENPPSPSEDWAGVLVLAPGELGSIEARDYLMNLLIDKWGQESNLARKIRKVLCNRITRDRHYPELFSDHVNKKLRHFEDYDWKLNKCIKSILENLSKKDDVWKRFSDKLDKGNLEGQAAGLAVMRCSGKDQLKLLEWLESSSRSAGFLNTVLSVLFQTSNFERLPANIQLTLLSHDTFRRFITSPVLNLLLNHCGFRDETVKDRIQELLKKITVQYGTSNVAKEVSE